MAEHERCSPPALNIPRDPVITDCYMPEIPLFNPRKRQGSEPPPLHANGTSSQAQFKRPKLNHPTIGSQPPPAFWDKLSKIWLTRGALRELNRRNIQPSSSQPQSPYRRARRPVTRNSLAGLKRNCQVIQTASDFLHRCKSRTLKDIKRFARNGGPDLSDLKGSSGPLDHTMSLSQSNSRRQKRQSKFTVNTQATTPTESSGPYSLNFQQKLVDNRIYPESYEYPDGRVPPEPDNLEEINEMLIQPRSSLSPSQFTRKGFLEFRKENRYISKENRATKKVFPIIEGKITNKKCVEGDIIFTNLEPLTDDTLKMAKPDLYYGARPEQLERRVRDELSDHIIPSTQDHLPIAPNFFVVAKGPNGTAAVAEKQACYDGALGARAMHSLQSYGAGQSIYDNKAYTITSIYSDGQLKMFTSHPTQPIIAGDRPGCCMNQLGAYAMTHNQESFRQGATAYRNARDWTREQRDEAIERANKRVNDSQNETLAVNAGLSTVSSFTTDASPNETDTITAPSQESRISQKKSSCTTTESPESETSTDENRLPAKRVRRHSKRLRQPHQR